MKVVTSIACPQKLTRAWHARAHGRLPAVGGDEGLAFALAFYSPDHPRYEERLVNPGAKPPPDHETVRQGWVALCFTEDAACVAATLVKQEFELQSSLLGQAGAHQRFTAVMVLPSAGLSPPEGAQEVSDIRRSRPERD